MNRLSVHYRPITRLQRSMRCSFSGSISGKGDSDCLRSCAVAQLRSFRGANSVDNNDFVTILGPSICRSNGKRMSK
jgi:hypothetical protein